MTNLSYLIKLSNLTHQQIGDKVGVSRQYISNWASAGEVSPRHMENFAKALDVPVEVIENIDSYTLEDINKIFASTDRATTVKEMVFDTIEIFKQYSDLSLMYSKHEDSLQNHIKRLERFISLL